MFLLIISPLPLILIHRLVTGYRKDGRESFRGRDQLQCCKDLQPVPSQRSHHPWGRCRCGGLGPRCNEVNSSTAFSSWLSAVCRHFNCQMLSCQQDNLCQHSGAGRRLQPVRGDALPRRSSGNHQPRTCGLRERRVHVRRGVREVLSTAHVP